MQSQSHPGQRLNIQTETLKKSKDSEGAAEAVGRPFVDKEDDQEVVSSDDVARGFEQKEEEKEDKIERKNETTKQRILKMSPQPQETRRNKKRRVQKRPLRGDRGRVIKVIKRTFSQHKDELSTNTTKELCKAHPRSKCKPRNDVARAK